MEGWRQRRPGSNARNPQKEKENRKRKTLLTHTGLLMEGVDPDVSRDLENFKNPAAYHCQPMPVG
jgi:hypothetical protein